MRGRVAIEVWGMGDGVWGRGDGVWGLGTLQQHMTYEASTYGDRIAAVYDAWVAPTVEATTDAAVKFLAELAGNGSALELGVGTGRIALPLAARGVSVYGIDSSEAMVAQLRLKPGGPDIPVISGDFADVPVDRTYRLGRRGGLRLGPGRVGR